MRSSTFAFLAVILAILTIAATARFQTPLHQQKYATYTDSSSFRGPEYKNITAQGLYDIWQLFPTDLYIVDVREVDEYTNAHIPGAKSFPLSTLETTWTALPTTGSIYVHCLGGVRSLKAIALLRQVGYKGDIYNVSDGFNAWPGPTESGAPTTATTTIKKVTNFDLMLESLYAMDIAPRPGQQQKQQQPQQQQKKRVIADLNALLDQIIGL